MPFAGYADFDDCVSKNSGKNDPKAYCATIMRATESRHMDFERIRNEFIHYYKNEDKGNHEYYQWLTSLHLDETREYSQAQESFQWAKDMLKFLREDNDNKYYRVLVGFPIRSMNGNVYRENDLIASAKTLVGQQVNLNHKGESQLLQGVTYIDANYEDGAVEGILKVPKTATCPYCRTGEKHLTEVIDNHHIVNVSLEGGCRNNPQHNNGECQGFNFTGCALLTTDVLPGIPMARIFPMESYVPTSQSPTLRIGDKKTRIKVIGLSETKQKEATVNPENPNTPKETPLPMPDGNMQCPEGTRYSAEQGGCVPTTSCPEDQIWNEEQGRCVPMPKHIPEGTEVLIGQEVAPDNSHVPLIEGDVTTERVARLKAEDKVRNLELNLAEWQNRHQTKDKQLQTLTGKYDESQKTIERLEKQISGLNSTRATDESTIKDYKRRLEDMTLSRDDYKAQFEDLSKKHEVLDAKYKEQLKTNLGLSKKLTEGNEEYLAIAKAKEETEEKLKKAKRLGKVVVKL